MRRALQLAAVLFLPVAILHAQFHLGGLRHKDNSANRKSDVEWLWQYSPADNNPEGRENDLIRDEQFHPMLTQYFTAPQTFWGSAVNGKYPALSDVILDFLTVPDKVLAEDNRYLSISGCVVHFCPSRGLLWVDLNAREPLMVFCAIDWIRDSKTVNQSEAEYTLWLFPDQLLSPTGAAANRIPPALTRSIAHWSAEPLAGSGIVQNITHAILVDPDGTPHELPVAALGVTLPKSSAQKDNQS